MTASAWAIERCSWYLSLTSLLLARLHQRAVDSIQSTGLERDTRAEVRNVGRPQTHHDKSTAIDLVCIYLSSFSEQIKKKKKKIKRSKIASSHGNLQRSL